MNTIKMLKLKYDTILIFIFLQEINTLGVGLTIVLEEWLQLQDQFHLKNLWHGLFLMAMIFFPYHSHSWSKGNNFLGRNPIL